MTGPSKAIRSTAVRYYPDAASARLALPLGLTGIAALVAGVALLTGVPSPELGRPAQVWATAALFLVGTAVLARSFRHLAPNVGGPDRLSRVVFGSVLVSAGVIGAGDLRLAVGLYLVMVGVAGLVGDRPVVGGSSLVGGLALAGGLGPITSGPLPASFISGVLAIIGVVTLATATTARCPVNFTMGIDTCGRAAGG